MAYYGKRGSNPSTNIFHSWSPINIMMFWMITIAIVASVFFLNVPIGVAFFLLVFTLPLIWKDPDDIDGIRGGMIYGTTPWKVASFMSVMKGPNRSHIFEFDDLFGIGPPENDKYTGLQEHFFSPPTRLAAYWSMLFALSFSFLEWLIRPILFPLWGDFTLPTIISQILTFFSLYASFQALNTARRYQLASTMPGVQVVPAVMLSHLPKDDSIKQSVWKFLISGAVATAAIMFVSWTVSMAAKNLDMPWLWISVAAVSFGVAVASFVAFQFLSERYREEFNFQIDRRQFWMNEWAFMKDKTPFFEMQTKVPGEVGQPGGAESDEEYDPEDVHVWAATFSYPANSGFGDYVLHADKIQVPEAEMLAIAPILKTDNEGQPIPGVPSNLGFRVWWSDIYIGMTDLLANPNITNEMKEIAIRTNIIDKLAQISGVGMCLVHSHSMMTAPDSKVHIMRLSVIPPTGRTEADFVKNHEKIRTSLGVKWLRMKRNVDANGRSVIELFIGDNNPDSEGIVFPKGLAATKYKDKLLNVHYEYIFAVNNASSQAGSPSIMMSRTVNEDSTEIVFDLPQGVSYATIVKNADGIKTDSGNTYIELHEGIPSRKSFSHREERKIQRYLSNQGSTAQFTAVMSPQHPLKKMFLFSKYRDKLITGRERGVAKTAWGAGVKSNGEIAYHDFSKGDPHLVLAGSSGSGKSVLLYSMIIQLCANNYPEDVQLQIIDPKIGYGIMQYIDNVVRFVDHNTPRSGDYFYTSVRDLYRDAVEEMMRRNTIFRFADVGDQLLDNLKEARRIGMEQGPNPDGSPNELIQPYIIIIADECALLFADAVNAEDKALQVEILYYATRLARESRSAGIHCLFATQYPTTKSIPSIIKQQSGRIGLKCSDKVASLVIIDQPGLEDLFIKGTGKIQEDGIYNDFRGFLVEDPGLGEHSMTDIIRELPKREPSREIDGDIAYELYYSRQDRGEEEAFVFAPAPDDSIFGQWDNSKAGKLYKAATEPDEETGLSKANRIRAVTDLLSSSDDPEDEFKAFDDMTLEEFREMVSDYESKKRKRRKK